MTLRTSMRAISATIQEWIDSLTGGKKQQFNYIREVLITLVVLAAITGGYFAYRWYRTNQEQSAYQLFAQNVEEFDRVMQEGKKEDWANVQTLFKLGYDQYTNSSLAPFFLVYQAETLLKQDKTEEALVMLDKAVAGMPTAALVYGLYKTKIALMRLDSSDKVIQDAGIEQLKTLAQDTANNNNDIAAYYLGLHYWDANDLAQAKKVWQALVERQKSTTQKLGVSPWATLAKTKLEQIA